MTERTEKHVWSERGRDGEEGYSRSDTENGVDGMDERTMQEKPERFDYDGFWKALIRRFWRELLRSAIPDLYRDADLEQEATPLDKELQDTLPKPGDEEQVSAKFVDTLLKIPLKDGGEQWVLLHIEVQGRGGEDLSRRMMRYYCLLFAHYDKNPIALAILTASRPKSETPGVYDFLQYGTRLHYSYNCVKLWNLDDEGLLASDNPFDLALYAAKKALAYDNEEQQKLIYLLKLTRILVSKGWSREDRSDLLAFIARVINLKDRALWEQYRKGAREIKGESEMMSFWDEELEQTRAQGRAQGRAEGRVMGHEEGREEGRQEGRLKGLMEVARRMLAVPLPVAQISELTGLTSHEIDALKKDAHAGLAQP